ncbi:GNAT family N-acetyltransferase [Ectobacillus ponti]|uniref:GNAT family N-acetyltransferase n=1 Tax=Ectobacillus ponti TaxID=2961894 RepID=A0AA41X6C3_9BACI|nr:GNAT family N-acetyltransferase [Ectobacillus ponti]MCP8967640.1 GNAT family N-acetyltransferase [Ectobacillus ponti]
MNLVIEKAELEKKSVLRRLMELYKYDFSEFDPEDVNEHGLYEYMYLDHYFTDADRFPFFFKVDGRYAGFALIRKMEAHYSMAEFFVMKKYRKSGIGKQAAQELFQRFPGTWEVAEMEENVPAQHFWRKVIGAYAAYEEIRKPDWDGPVQLFYASGD